MNRNTTTALLTLTALTIASTASAEDNCEYERELNATVSVATLLEIKARSGTLTITGDDAADDVRVEGRACASSESLLDDIELVTDDGNTGLVEAVTPQFDGGWWGKRYAALHLDLTVPAELALSIKDGSGSIVARNIGPTELKDGSGSVDIGTVNGNLEITDGSGSISVREVSGDVWIPNDGSGSIDIANVDGAVRIGDDGSGSIEIVDVGSDVEIDRDGSGSIDVRQIAGNFTVHRDGSGGIHSSDIEGSLDLPRGKGDRRRK